MAKPKLERNGEGEVQETDQNAIVSDEPIVAPIVPDSPVPKTESPVKQVVFRSVDRELILHQKAATIDKSHGIPVHVPGTGVEFKDWFKRFDDTPANAVAIKWLRTHERNGVAFKEVPDLSAMVELPTINQMKELSIGELKELCVKNVVTISESDSKESIILALLQKVK